MKSPFPGMDPYLEDPALWPGLHDKLIYNLVETLNGVLPDDYVADMQHRLYVAYRHAQIVPDVLTTTDRDRIREPAIRAATAVLSRTDTPAILVAPPEEVSESFVEIRHLAAPKRVVTVIEILSHSNKTPGSEGRASYLLKQRDVLSSDVHLLEVDLLRKGEHTLAAPFSSIVAEFGTWDYLVSVCRSPDRWRHELHLRTVRQSLPCIAVPLANADPDVRMDLQDVFTRCYAAGAYRRQVDYRRTPYFALNEADAKWAETLLVEKGLRNGARKDSD